jgi:hypothetical protein
MVFLTKMDGFQKNVTQIRMWLKWAYYKGGLLYMVS